MRRRVNIDKASVFAIVINAIQIVACAAVAGIFIFTDMPSADSLQQLDVLVCVLAVLIICGACADIVSALAARRVKEQSEMLEEAYRQLESLNSALRAQRHDFRNHLQVIGGLAELGDAEAAADYIDRVYGSVGQLSESLRTASPAVNALLRVKMAEAEKRGVALEARILSAWEGLTVPGWELCRVLGNLIDNAMDALSQTQGARVVVTLGEDRRSLTFSVENNGPMIPEDIRENIFQPGFSTKGEERGHGLAIVREIVAGCGGDIRLESTKEHTVFAGRLPKPAAEPPAQ